MWRALAFLGVIVILLSLFAFYWQRGKRVQFEPVEEHDKQKEIETKKVYILKTTPGGNRLHPVPTLPAPSIAEHCVIKHVDCPGEVKTDDWTKSVTVTVGNPTKKCQVKVTGVGITIEPGTPVPVDGAQSEHEWKHEWKLLPLAPGKCRVDVDLEDATGKPVGERHVVPIDVLTPFGVTAETLAYLQVVGFILGPMLTVPWWLSRRKGGNGGD